MLRVVTILFCLVLHAGQTHAQYFPPVSGNTWDTVSPASLGWCTDKISPFLDYVGDINTKAFIVLKGGKIAIEKYYGTFTRDSLWYWASAGKTLTSFAVGMAQQEGKLSINDKTSDYLGTGWTDCPLNKENLITIKNQLSMTSGLDDAVADPHCTLDTCLQYKADAGTRWAYHNGPYTKLDGVIQGATGQNLNLYLTQKLKTPTGMTGSFFMSGYDNVYVSTARSMARFGLLILNKGVWNGNVIMSDTTYFREMTNTSQQLNKSYGYLWWLNGKQSFMVPGVQLVIPGSVHPAAPKDMISALGKNGQFINVVPSLDIVMIRMGNVPSQGDVPFLYNDTLWQKFNGVMCNSSIQSQTALKLDIYPNPVNDRIYIKGLESSSTYRIRIYNMQGQELLNTSDKESLNLSGLHAGLYTITVEQNGKIYRKVLVKH